MVLVRFQRAKAASPRGSPGRRERRGSEYSATKRPARPARPSRARRADLELLVEAAQKFVLAELAEQELEAVLLAVLALAVAEIDAHHRLAGDQQVALGHELAPEVRDLGRRAEAAGDVDREAAPAVGNACEEADVVDHRVVARAAGEADLELPGELAVVLVEEEVPRDGVGVGGDVESFVLDHAGEGRGGDVAQLSEQAPTQVTPASASTRWTSTESSMSR